MLLVRLSWWNDYWTASPYVTVQFHPALLNRITLRYWIVSPALLNRITLRYLTVSPGVTEPYHLTLLDSFSRRYWTVSFDVTGQLHLALLNVTWQFHLASLSLTSWNKTQPWRCHVIWVLYVSWALINRFKYRFILHDVIGQQSSCSTCKDQLFDLRLFLETIAINMTNMRFTRNSFPMT